MAWMRPFDSLSPSTDLRPRVRETPKRTLSSLGCGQSWRGGETYIKVKSQWAYRYRAVNISGHTIDFNLPPTRNANVAQRFLGKVLRPCKDGGRCPTETEHRMSEFMTYHKVELDYLAAAQSF